MDGEFIKVNKDIRKGKKVNIVFDILHIVGNSPIILLRTSKIIAMDHDPSACRRDIHLFESSPSHIRCGEGRNELHYGGRDELHYGGRNGPKNCIEKQLVLSELENMVRIGGGGRGGGIE